MEEKQMNHDAACNLLNIEHNASQADIEAAWLQRQEEILGQLRQARDSVQRQRSTVELDELQQARDMLLTPAAADNYRDRVIGRSASGLSDSKFDDVGWDGDEDFSPEDTQAQLSGLQAGAVLSGRFEIQQQIGVGGMGVVYRAHDRNRRVDIAIKVMKPGLLRNEAALQRFRNEAQISIELSHPHIVKTHDVNQDGDFQYLTMELLQGRSLRSEIERRTQAGQPWELAEVMAIAETICQALSYAHKKTIHRDIKPENIWLDDEGQAKLMDFGIAKLLNNSQLTKTAAVMGSIQYMAPEQLQGAKHVDHRADQYSLAVMLYEMLTGRIPMGRFKLVAELRPEVGTVVSDVIMKALSEEPTERYADIVTFLRALKNAAPLTPSRPAGEGANESQRHVKSPEPPAIQADGEPGGKDTEKSNKATWYVGLLLVFLLGGGAYLWLGKPEPAAPQIEMVAIPGRNYELGKYDVTQGEWQSVMGSNPSYFRECGKTCPVEQVSWLGVQEFLKKLNSKTGKQYRLPTEAEWEYACYGGSKTEYCGGDNLDALGWYDKNSGNTTHPVGKKQANGYGLHDMSGNVWEWMENCYDSSCDSRVLRGGSWSDAPAILRAAFRSSSTPDIRSYYGVGFRVAR